MRKIVHRIDAPFVASALMTDVANAVQRRITKIDIWRTHVDLRSENMFTVSKLTLAHTAKQVEVFLDATVPMRAVLARFFQRTAKLTNFFRTQAVNIGTTTFDERLCGVIQLFEIVGCMRQTILPVESEPAHIFLYGTGIHFVFLDWIRVIEAEEGPAFIFVGNPEIKANRFRMTDVQVAVRLRRKSCDDGTVVFAARNVFGNNLANEIDRLVVAHDGSCRLFSWHWGHRPWISSICLIAEKPISAAFCSIIELICVSSSSATDLQPRQIRNWPACELCGSGQPT